MDVDLWVCCLCGGANLIPLMAGHCPVCGHEMCPMCSYDAGYATTGRECDAEREVYNDASVSPDHSEREDGASPGTIIPHNRD